MLVFRFWTVFIFFFFKHVLNDINTSWRECQRNRKYLQYNVKVIIMVNLLNIGTIYWLSAALIKKKNLNKEEVPAFKNRYVKSYNMPITITVNGAG